MKDDGRSVNEHVEMLELVHLIHFGDEDESKIEEKLNLFETQGKYLELISFCREFLEGYARNTSK